MAPRERAVVFDDDFPADHSGSDSSDAPLTARQKRFQRKSAKEKRSRRDVDGARISTKAQSSTMGQHIQVLPKAHLIESQPSTSNTPILPQLIIGINFGTQTSAIACAFIDPTATLDSYASLEAQLNLTRHSYVVTEVPSTAAIVPDTSSHTLDAEYKMIFPDQANYHMEISARGTRCVRFFKLGRGDSVAPGFENETAELARIKGSHTKTLRWIRNKAGGKVNVYSVFNKTKSVWSIENISDIEAAFHSHLMDLVKAWLRFTEDNIQSLTSNAKVAVGMPTLWSDAALDNARYDLASKSLFPKNTLILSETKAATTSGILGILHHNDFPSNLGRRTGHESAALDAEFRDAAFIGADVGCGTMNTTSLKLSKTDGHLRFNEVVGELGSLCGGHHLNEIFTSNLIADNRELIDVIIQQNDILESVLSEAIFEAFEKPKFHIKDDNTDYLLSVCCLLPKTARSGTDARVWAGQIRVGR
jgi:hypothetical protein